MPRILIGKVLVSCLQAIAGCSPQVEEVMFKLSYFRQNFFQSSTRVQPNHEGH